MEICESMIGPVEIREEYWNQKKTVWIPFSSVEKQKAEIEDSCESIPTLIPQTAQHCCVPQPTSAIAAGLWLSSPFSFLQY